MSNSDPLVNNESAMPEEPGALELNEKARSPIKLRFKNVSKATSRNAAYSIRDGTTTDGLEYTAHSHEAVLPSLFLPVQSPPMLPFPSLITPPLATSVARSLSAPPIQLPPTAPISRASPPVISRSQPSTGIQPQTPQSSAHPIDPHQLRDSDPGSSPSEQHHIHLLEVEMPSQEEELARIRNNMAFLDSDPDPSMDNNLDVWAYRRYADEERQKLKGIIQDDSPLAMAMNIQKVVRPFMHHGVYRSSLQNGGLEEKKAAEAKARIQRALIKFRPSPSDLAKLAELNTHLESHETQSRDISLKGYSDIQNMPLKDFTPHLATYGPFKKPTGPSECQSRDAPQYTYTHRAASNASAGAPSELINPNRLRPGRGIDGNSGLTTAAAKAKERVSEALAEYDDDYEENLEEMEKYLAMPEKRK